MQGETAALAMDAIQRSVVQIGVEDQTKETLCWSQYGTSSLVVGGGKLRSQFKKEGGGAGARRRVAAMGREGRAQFGNAILWTKPLDKIGAHL